MFHCLGGQDGNWSHFAPFFLDAFSKSLNCSLPLAGSANRQPMSLLERGPRPATQNRRLTLAAFIILWRFTLLLWNLSKF